MAGGVKKPVNIFRLRKLGEPEEIFNRRLWLAVFSFSLLGAARGVDEGLISGAFNSKHFQDSIRYGSYTKVEQANIKANVSAMVQIGSVGGALMYVLVSVLLMPGLTLLDTAPFSSAIGSVESGRPGSSACFGLLGLPSSWPPMAILAPSTPADSSRASA